MSLALIIITGHYVKNENANDWTASSFDIKNYLISGSDGL